MVDTVDILRLTPRPGQRLLVTSDIHGHAHYLDAILRMANFSGDDLLIVVGDLLDKGADSLGVLRRVMRLVRDGRCYAVWGNIDLWRYQRLRGALRSKEEAERFYTEMTEMNRMYGHDFFSELYGEMGFMPKSGQEVFETLPTVAEHFKEELAFLESLPTVIETPCYRFVHGGLPSPEADLSQVTPMSLMKYNWFLRTAREEGMVFDKYTVVGHWPVSLNREDYTDSNPIIDRQTRTISIDGGCGVMLDGQLDLLVIPSYDAPVEAFYHYVYDDFPSYTVQKDQDPAPTSFFIHWHDDAVTVLELDQDMAYVEHTRTGYRMWVPLAYLYFPSPENITVGISAKCRDCTDYRLPVKAGEVVSMVRKTSRGIMAKKNGISGWVDSCL